MFTDIVEETLRALTLASGILIAFLALIFASTFVTGKKSEMLASFRNWFSRHYLVLGFIVSLSATLGSLFYSEIMGFAPCVLCWYQRIFMYSQVVLFATAWFAKDGRVAVYSLTLSIVGGAIAAYHYLMQLDLVSAACSVVGYSASCSEYFAMSYGYITIPMMALTAFALLIVLGFSALRAQQRSAAPHLR